MRIHNSLVMTALSCGALLLSPLGALAASATARSGDTLTGIAARNGVSVQALMGANPGLTPRRLRPGQRVQLPGSVVPARAGTVTQPAGQYTVRAGDTLFNIAQRTGVSLDTLRSANPAVGGRALQIGTPLALPGSGARVTAGSRAVVRASSLRVNWVVPLQGRLTQPFHADHLAIDIAAPTGSLIVAARAGTVTTSKFDARNGWGWTVVVDHGGGLSTRYSHNSANLARVGQQVQAGQPIARVGSTGHSTGPHLDYRVYVGGNPVNPSGLY